MKNILRKMPLVMVYIIIIYFSVKKPSGGSPLFANIDKVYHFLAYSALGFSLCLFTTNRKIRIILLVIGLGLGIGLEYVQGQLPYRDMSFADGVADMLGLFAGVLIFYVFKRLLEGYKHVR